MKINTIKMPTEEELFVFLNQHFYPIKVENLINPIVGFHYIQIRENAFKGVVVKLNKENQITVDKTIPSLIGRMIPFVGIIVNAIGRNLANEIYDVLCKEFGQDS